jgi:hypothetical protein
MNDSEWLDVAEDALQQIAQWARAYPLSIWPEPTKEYLAKADAVLRANGLTIDRITCSAMRHVIKQVANIAETALAHRKDDV